MASVVGMASLMFVVLTDPHVAVGNTRLGSPCSVMARKLRNEVSPASRDVEHGSHSPLPAIACVMTLVLLTMMSGEGARKAFTAAEKAACRISDHGRHNSRAVSEAQHCTALYILSDA